MKKAMIAMSGGVDSSVAAWLMKRDGYDCMGVTMRLFAGEDSCERKGHTCCSLDDVEDARSVARQLGIPYFVFNFTEDFGTQILDRLVCTYENGFTPNPCIDCNRYMKFEKLMKRAKELDYDYVVTGHYARIEEQDGKFLLKKAIDEKKDQSYVLYSLTQEQLAHTLTVIRRRMKDSGQVIVAVEPSIGTTQMNLKTLQTSDGANWWYAFTSFNEEMKGADSVKSTFLVDIDKLFDAALTVPEIKGVILNPWNRTLMLDKGLIRIIKPE